MNIVISPAKKLDFNTPVNFETTENLLAKQTKSLATELKKLSKDEIKKLMKLSDSLADLNYERYQGFAKTKDKRPAVFAFVGDTYMGLQARDFSKSELTYAQKHLQILSGLFGVLRPLDELRPYRLEMGTKFSFKNNKDLYSFWDEEITLKLNELSKNSKSKYLVNLASDEYFKSVQIDKLEAKLINVKFLEQKGDKYKVIGLMAKRARGMMAAFIIKNKVKKIEDLEKFSEAGYKFSKSESDELNLVFKRKEKK